MSYCRFSESSDIYCYPASYGIVIRVAVNRFNPIIGDFQEIGLGEDGKTFNCDNYLEAYNVLLELQKQGYRIPQYTIDRFLRVQEGNY